MPGMSSMIVQKGNDLFAKPSGVLEGQFARRCGIAQEVAVSSSASQFRRRGKCKTDWPCAVSVMIERCGAARCRRA